MASPHPEQPEFHASDVLRWPQDVSNLADKQAVADRAAALVQPGQTVGIGSGSAAYLALLAIGERVRAERVPITVVTASIETQTAALRLSIPLVPLGSAEPDWGVDGADEVAPDGRVLKGRGGAMFREKILWATARRMYLAVDASKHVERLGAGFPVPIEVDRSAVSVLSRALVAQHARSFELRLASGKDGPVITEAGNLIVDAWFDSIEPGLHGRLKALPGVIETGLFEGYDYELL